MTDVRRYLQTASISNSGLLVHRVHDPFVFQKELIIVPKSIVSGLLTALHLHFSHASKNQLTKLFNRHFYAIGSEASSKLIVDSCSHCNSLKSLPKEIMEQSSGPTPSNPGQQFAADVIRRTRQKILLVREVFSSFTCASLITDETGEVLRDNLLTLTALLRSDSCTIQVDNAPGFQTLRQDDLLTKHGITLDFGCIKNPNKNAVADKAIQEFEDEILRVDPSGAPISEITLAKALQSINLRIRKRGLSAREILFGRDQTTGERLNFEDAMLSEQQARQRTENHGPSATSKASKKLKALRSPISVGDLVFIKAERSKLKGRDRYMIMNVSNKHCTLQKITGSLFSSRRYEVPLTEVYPVATPTQSELPLHTSKHPCSSDDSDIESDQEVVPAVPPPPVPINNEARRNPPQERRQPTWLRGQEWERE